MLLLPVDSALEPVPAATSSTASAPAALGPAGLGVPAFDQVLVLVGSG
jgi:hypothetical protein